MPDQYTLTIRKEIYYECEVYGEEIDFADPRGLPPQHADLFLNPGKYGKITEEQCQIVSYEKGRIRSLNNPFLIPVADDEVVNVCQIVEMSVDEETGDLLVILGDGSSISFEPEQAGEFLDYFDSSLFEKAPKILELKEKNIPF